MSVSGSPRTSPKRFERRTDRVESFEHRALSKVLLVQARALRVRKDNPASTVKAPDRGKRKTKQFLFPSELLALVSCADVPLAWRRNAASMIGLASSPCTGDVMTRTCVRGAATPAIVRQRCRTERGDSLRAQPEQQQALANVCDLRLRRAQLTRCHFEFLAAGCSDFD